MKRFAALIALIAALGTVVAAPAGGAEPRASLTDIEDEVMCPICGTPLNLAAAPQAERERAFIRRLIARGQSKEEIKDALVREYGPEVLATPESDGFDLAAWAVPGSGHRARGDRARDRGETVAPALRHARNRCRREGDRSRGQRASALGHRPLDL